MKLQNHQMKIQLTSVTNHPNNEVRSSIILKLFSLPDSKFHFDTLSNYIPRVKFHILKLNQNIDSLQQALRNVLCQRERDNKQLPGGRGKSSRLKGIIDLKLKLGVQ